MPTSSSFLHQPSEPQLLCNPGSEPAREDELVRPTEDELVRDLVERTFTAVEASCAGSENLVQLKALKEEFKGRYIDILFDDSDNGITAAKSALCAEIMRIEHKREDQYRMETELFWADMADVAPHMFE
jgi:hypothetical protein